jgi:hypothetical protein
MIAIETTEFLLHIAIFCFPEINFPLSQIPGIPPREGSRLTQGVWGPSSAWVEQSSVLGRECRVLKDRHFSTQSEYFPVN